VSLFLPLHCRGPDITWLLLQTVCEAVGFRSSRASPPTGRERMVTRTLQTLQDPILLVPWLCFRGGCHFAQARFRLSGTQDGPFIGPPYVDGAAATACTQGAAGRAEQPKKVVTFEGDRSATVLLPQNPEVHLALSWLPLREGLTGLAGVAHRNTFLAQKGARIVTRRQRNASRSKTSWRTRRRTLRCWTWRSTLRARTTLSRIRTRARCRFRLPGGTIRLAARLHCYLTYYPPSARGVAVHPIRA
jgi:hypothetical protein